MTELFILASITLLSAISPGPDMIIVVKNALKTKKLAYMTALGVWLATLVHVAYCIAWIGIIISQSIVLFSVIKIFGALYLLYISYQLFRSWKNESESIEASMNQSLVSAFRQGFITNVLNPKATLFFLSVFTQVINSNTSLMTQVGYGIMMASIVGLWFVILATLINIRSVKSHISSVQYYLNKIMWGILAILGIKILLSTK